YPALAQAAGLVSAPQLRNVGTLGGNLCVDTRCNYYNQTEFWRASIGYCMKKDGEICLVAPGSPRCWAISSSDCAPARISLGAVASHPIEPAQAAQLLAGQRLTPELIEAVAAAAARPAKPLDNADLTIGYRKQMVPIFVRRALEELAGVALRDFQKIN